MHNMLSDDLLKTDSSLDPTKIPTKLHCPSCDKFLYNGYKLPCCDQSVCETCESLLRIRFNQYLNLTCPPAQGFSSISDHCPICEHRPMSQEMCKPNKALRNTAKAYLKTAERTLADERAKAEAASTPITLVTKPSEPRPIEVPVIKEESPVFNPASAESVVEEVAGSAVPDPPVEDQPHLSIEVYLFTLVPCQAPLTCRRTLLLPKVLQVQSRCKPVMLV